MTKPLVSIIILTYGKGLPHIKKCLNSLQKISYKNHEVIIVDNASIDETISYTESQFPKIKLIKNKKNLGFCRANNQAVKKAHGKYILLLNNDTQVSPNFLEPLVEDLERDRSIGVVQPKIRQLAKKSKLDACASYLTNTGFLYHYGYSQKESSKKYNNRLFIYSAKGACLLTRKKIIDKIGLFDNDYFAYFEDTDFCHRVWLYGYKVMYEPTAEVFHLGDREISAFLQFSSYKNRIATYIKNFAGKTLFLILPIHIFICFLICTVYLFKGKAQYSAVILAALVWNLLNISTLLYKRSIIQNKFRKIKDDELLPLVKKNVKLSYYKHFLLNPRGLYDFEEIV